MYKRQKVERMLGYTNLESERGFDFFQKFMKENGVIERLTEMGIEEGDTVRLYNLEFDYYRSVSYTHLDVYKRQSIG